MLEGQLGAKFEIRQHRRLDGDIAVMTSKDLHGEQVDAGIVATAPRTAFQLPLPLPISI